MFPVPTYLGVDHAGNTYEDEAWQYVIALIRAANAGQLQGFKNALLNGAMNVWQRGTSFAAVADGTYTADRWAYYKSGAMVHTISRSTDVPSLAQMAAAGQPARLFNYSMLIDCTTVDASIGSGDYCMVEQAIEGFNWLNFAQRGCKLQVWVKHTKTGPYCVALANSGQDRSYIAEYTVNAADTWEFKTLYFTASPSGGTWDYTTGVGARVRFVLAAGSSVQGAAGSWLSVNAFATSNQVNACDDTANNFRIVGLQFEAVDETDRTESAFEHMPFAVELSRCQRYYEKSFEYATAPAQAIGNNTGEAAFPQPAGASAPGVFGMRARFAVPKRTAPTVTTYNPFASNAHVHNSAAGADWSGTAVSNISQNGFDVTGTTPGGSSQATKCGFHWQAAAEF